MRGNVFAIVLVVTGTLVLLNNLGLVEIHPWELLRTWWPLIPIAIGLSLLVTPEPRIKGRAPQQDD